MRRPDRLMRSVGAGLAAAIAAWGAPAAADDLPVFTTRFEIPHDGGGTLGLVAADINDNGRIDLVATGSGVLRMLLNQGGEIPVFEEVPITEIAGGGWSAAVGDINGNGRLDVVSSFSGMQSVREIQLHLSDGDDPLGFSTETIAHWGTQNLSLGDMNGNGLLDIVATREFSDERLHVFFNNPSAPGAFEEVLIRDVPIGRSAVAHDIDGDENLDIVYGGATSNTVLLLRNTSGDGVNYEQHSVFTSPDNMQWDLFVAAGDVTGNGLTDIVSTWAREDVVRLHRNLGGSPPVFETTLIGEADGPVTASSGRGQRALAREQPGLAHRLHHARGERRDHLSRG